MCAHVVVVAGQWYEGEQEYEYLKQSKGLDIPVLLLLFRMFVVRVSMVALVVWVTLHVLVII